MLDVLTRFRAADVEKAVNALDTEQMDILMKYLYRGFANPTENSCGILLVWHEKVVMVGINCVMWRVGINLNECSMCESSLSYGFGREWALI